MLAGAKFGANRFPPWWTTLDLETGTAGKKWGARAVFLKKKRIAGKKSNPVSEYGIIAEKRGKHCSRSYPAPVEKEDPRRKYSSSGRITEKMGPSRNKLTWEKRV